MVQSKDSLTETLEAVRALVPAGEPPRPATLEGLLGQTVSPERYREVTDGADPAGLVGLWALQSLADNTHCADELAERLASLQGHLLALAARPDLALWQRAQTLQKLDRLLFHWQCWYPGLGGAGRKFLQRCDDLLQQIQVAEEPAALDEACEAFNRAADRELDRAAKVAERLQASETGSIKAAYARYQVAARYNQWVAGRPLPESVLTFVTDQLVPALQYTLINEGDQSSAWAFWARMLRLMVWSLAPDKSPEDVTAFYNRGPAMVSQLEAAEPPHNCAPDAFAAFVKDVSDAVITLLRGQTPEMVEAPPMDEGEGKALARQLETGGESHHFAHGDWLEFDAESGSLRCQFLLQVPGTDQLLFVNRLGHKVLQKSVGEMRACLAAGIAREIPQVPACTAALNTAAARLAQWHSQLSEAHRAARAEEHERAERERAHREAHEREQAARREAEAKARAEAERLARQKREQIERESARQRQSEAEQRIDALTMGTWADLPDAAGRSLRCKLAVSMRSTGKYIFVDRVGSKVAELQRDELIDLLLNDRAAFYEPEQGFENRLETIVRGLRRTD